MGVVIQLALGCLFGVVLTRTGAADFDAMERMFLLEESHLFALAAVTTLASALGLNLLLRSSWGSDIRPSPRLVQRGSVLGGVVFGLGWGLSGACPGTVLSQLGSGHIIAVCTGAGVLLGNWLYERLDKRRFGLRRDNCS